MSNINGFRDTDDGLMAMLWDWYTTPPCGDEDNGDSEEFIRSIQPDFSKSDTRLAAEVLDTYIHSRRRLNTQVNLLQGHLQHMSLENANLREQLQTQNQEKLEEMEDSPPVSNCLDLPRPSMLVQSASCSHLDRLCVSHSETESIVPVRVRSLQRRPPASLVKESFGIADTEFDDSDDDNEDDDISISDIDDSDFTDESSSLQSQTTGRKLRKRILTQLYKADKKAHHEEEDNQVPKSFAARLFGGISNFEIVSIVKNGASGVLENFTGYTMHELFKTENAKPDKLPLQFSVGKMKKSVKRFQKSVKPLVKFVIYLKALIDWKHQQFTLVAFGVYMLSVMTGWFVQLVLLLCILKLYANYIVTHRFPINIQFIPDMRRFTLAEDEMPFSDLGITNKFQMLLQIAKRAQHMLENYANNLEKIHNLFMWKVPGLTMFLFRILVVLFILSVTLSGIQFLKLLGLFIGFKIIILQRIYQKYPNFKYATDTTYKVWQALPTDAEYYEQMALDKLKKRKHRFNISKKKKMISERMQSIQKSVSRVGGKVSRAGSSISRRVSRGTVFTLTSGELPPFQTLKDGGRKDSEQTDIDGEVPKQSVQVVVTDSKRLAENDDVHPPDVSIKGKSNARSYFSLKGKFSRLRKTSKQISISPNGSIALASTSESVKAPVASISSPGKPAMASKSSAGKGPTASTSPGKAVVTPETLPAKPAITSNVPPGKAPVAVETSISTPDKAAVKSMVPQSTIAPVKEAVTSTPKPAKPTLKSVVPPGKAAVKSVVPPGKAAVKSVVPPGKAAVKSVVPPGKAAVTSTLPTGKEVSYSRSIGLSSSSEEFSLKKNNSHDLASSSDTTSVTTDSFVPSNSRLTAPLLRRDSFQQYPWGSGSYSNVAVIKQALGEQLNSFAGRFFTRQATLIVANQDYAQMELPNGEQIVKEAPNGWTCVLEENASLVATTFQPGTLYLSLSSLCFKPTDLTSSQWIIIDLTNITKIVKAAKARWIPGGNRSEHIQITVEGIKKPYVFGSVYSHNECFKVIMIHGKVHGYPWADEYIDVPLVFLNNEEKCFSFASLYQGITTDLYAIR